MPFEGAFFTEALITLLTKPTTLYTAHFLSDVFMGGALGYSIARFAVLRQ